MRPTPYPTRPTTRRTDRALPTARRRRFALAAGIGLAAGGMVAAGGTAGAVVDGEATTAGQNPWQVALVADGEQFCGGSLVSDRIVVTAAHCVVGEDPSQFEVRAGVTDLRTDAGQTISVAGVVEHHAYRGESSDIAMLVLDRPAELNESVATIPIATPTEAAAATTARVTGWGALSETDERAVPVMQTADVPIVDDEPCDADLEGLDAMNELCAGGTGTDSCYGDSGGPLTILTDRGRVLAGVTSWGEACGGTTPGVYVEVPAFADWIDERIADPDAEVPDRIDVDELPDDFFDDEFDEDWFEDDFFDGEFDEDWFDDGWFGDDSIEDEWFGCDGEWTDDDLTEWDDLAEWDQFGPLDEVD